MCKINELAKLEKAALARGDYAEARELRAERQALIRDEYQTRRESVRRAMRLA